MNNRTKSVIEVHIAAVLLGFVGIFVQAISMPLVAIAAWRSLFAVNILVLLLLYKKQSLKLKSRKDYLFFIVIGVFQAAQWLTFFKSVREGGMAIGLISLFTFPVLLALLEPIFFKERFMKSHLIFSLLITVGVGFMIPEFTWTDGTLRGVFWGMLSALLMAIPMLVHRSYIKDYTSLQMTTFKTIVTLIILIPAAIFIDYELTQRNVSFLIMMGVFATAVPYLLFVNSLRTLSAREASSILSLEVVHGILLGIFIFSEIPQVRTIIGGLIIMSVAVYVTKGA